MNIYDDYADEVVGKEILERTIESYYDDEIVSIRSYAFGYCSNLSFVSCPKVNYIGDNAFVGCSILSSAIFSSSLASLGYDAFANTALSFFDATLLSKTRIEDGTFLNCSNLISVSLFLVHSSLSTYGTVGQYAFSSCHSLETLNTNLCPSYIGGSAFCECYNVSFSSSFFQNIRYAGEKAFFKCSMLTYGSFSLLSGFSSYAFQYTGITSVYLEAFTGSLSSSKAYGVGCFAYCSDLSEISLPNAVAIPHGMFSNCGKLTSVYLPEVSKLSDYCFAYCSSLTYLSVPKLTQIKFQAIVGCSKLKYFEFPSTFSMFESGYGYIANDGSGVMSIVFLYDGVVQVSGNYPGRSVFYPYDNASRYDIYVPDSYVNAYKTISTWSYYSSKIFPISDLQN